MFSIHEKFLDELPPSALTYMANLYFNLEKQVLGGELDISWYHERFFRPD